MLDSRPTPPAVSNLPELSVSELAGAVKRTMETTFDRVRVRGELGRVTIAKSGHLYADLKDANACLSLVMWKSNVMGLRGFRPEEGLEVVCEGRLSTFPGKSQYQLVADRMEPAGVGALLAQLERLKAKLAAEGLFAAERKKPIPFLPHTIGVVTSPTGAVIRDILHRLEERFPRRVLLWPVLVQGEYAARQVSEAIRGFNRLEGDLRPDVLIVARGGGSIEDLWAFNEEIVVRATAESAIPLISAVGHETDTTLIDFAADRRAPTPTAAAEMAVPVRADLLARVEESGGRLSGGLLRALERRRMEIKAASARLPRPEALLAPSTQRCDRVGEGLDRALRRVTENAAARFDRVAARLRPQALTLDVARRQARLAELERRLGAGLLATARAARTRYFAVAGRLSADLAAAGFDRRAERLSAASRLLETLSHRSVLSRGFALVTRNDGALVRSADALSQGDALTLTFADGAVAASVGETAPKRKARKEDPEGGEQGALF